MLKNVVGLFGTCGASKWRENIVVPALTTAGVDSFNPVVEHWDEEAQRREVDHAATDKVVMIVITGETTGIASMAELGWIALNAETAGQKLVIVLEDMPNDVKDETGASLRINKARSLVRKYIKATQDRNPNSFVFLEENISAATQKVIELMKG